MRQLRSERRRQGRERRRQYGDKEDRLLTAAIKWEPQGVEENTIKHTGGAGSLEGEGRGLRLGYFNSQGLDENNWRRCQRWIEDGDFDLLFVAETWYVGWLEYSTYRHTLAVTPKPIVTAGSRHTGGICLFGTPEVRREVVGDVEICESMITIQVGRWRISGVYFPPSQHPLHVERVLRRASTSDVVLGDVNIRFGKKSGEGTPKERVQVVMDWAQASDLFHLQPSGACSSWPAAWCRMELTLDHCFIRWTGIQSSLYLLDTRRLRLRTDHRYLMLLYLGCCEGRRRYTADSIRFNIHRLVQRDVRERLRRCWDVAVPDGDVWLLSQPQDVDGLNRAVVELSQNVCGRVLGQKPKRHMGQPPASREGKALASDPSPQGTHRLVRQALVNDGENSVLLPQQSGRNPLDEMVERLEERYTASNAALREDWAHLSNNDTGDLSWELSQEEVAAEIAKQGASKACGSDGIHIRALKALSGTSLTRLLTALFNRCIAHGVTPRSWNSTDVHLLVKDGAAPKTTANVRPITLICMFRKIFECLLLKRFDDRDDGWARVHPTQAGFRRSYSTLTNAALLHMLLDRKHIRVAIFLDFRAAFDVVDHDLLIRILRQRQCPSNILSLIRSLMVDGVYSRIFANGDTSRSFVRTCGVLQGSPLSPALFNIFVDGLLSQLNRSNDVIPRALFYADDGVLLARQEIEVQPLLDEVRQWTQDFKIELNVKKCATVSSDPDLLPAWWGDERILQVERYKYLGFPVTSEGIDFESYLELRMRAALQKADFLRVHSRLWGQAHRLRFYRQYLAPIFEYGAPLLWTWSQMGRPSREKWDRVTASWKDLICWIAGSRSGWRLAANLLGLPMLDQRFEMLHAAHVLRLEQASSSDPLRRFLELATLKRTFASQLQKSTILKEWKEDEKDLPDARQSLNRFLLRKQSEWIQKAANTRHLSRLILFDVRMRRGHRFADVTLEVPLADQDMLFRYRQGIWQVRQRHKCATVDRMFRRGDEECDCWDLPQQLSAADRRQKLAMREDGRFQGKFTDVDYLLNIGQFQRAAQRLRAVRKEMFRRNSLMDSHV